MSAFGRYEILRPLARGGMAEVFLARRRSGSGIEKRLVIKRIRSERAGDPRLLALFVREARVSMALSHQNIVPVFDFGRADDALFLAMEHVDGRDLGAVLACARERDTLMDPALIAFVGAECCAALAYAHGRRFEDGTVGVVHRDVSPRNILLSWSGEVRLTDFGVAALQRDEIGAIRGTPAYMAPEQARGDELDGRADLYALALVLWEAATGLRVRSSDPPAALAQARAGTPPPPAEIPAALAEAIAQATAHDPAHRFADARAMQDALDQAGRVVARGGAPSRRLADWLAGLFPETDRGDADPEAPSPLAAVTFLDDGEDALLGTGTALSMAGTAADVDVDVGIAIVEPVAPPRRRGRWLAGALAMVAIVGGALTWRAVGTRPSGAPTDAGMIAANDPDAAPAPDARGPRDARIEIAVDAGPVDAPPPAPPDAGRPRALTPDAGRLQPPPADAAAATPVRPRRVTIGARPWATFYVDGDPTAHETPETLELAPGPHRVRFVNEQAHVEREITIDVPVDRDIKHVEILVPDSTDP